MCQGEWTCTLDHSHRLTPDNGCTPESPGLKGACSTWSKPHCRHRPHTAHPAPRCFCPIVVIAAPVLFPPLILLGQILRTHVCSSDNTMIWVCAEIHIYQSIEWSHALQEHTYDLAARGSSYVAQHVGIFSENGSICNASRHWDHLACDVNNTRAATRPQQCDFINRVVWFCWSFYLNQRKKERLVVRFDSVRRFRATLLLRTTCMHLYRNGVANCVSAYQTKNQKPVREINCGNWLARGYMPAH